MRILLVNNHWRASGGAETVVRHTRALLEAAGHEVLVFAMAESPGDPPGWPRPTGGGTTGARAAGPVRGLWSLDAHRRLRRLLAREHVDVAHLHNVYEALTLSVLDALDARGVPAVLTAHDYRAVCANGVLRRPGGAPCSACVDSAPLAWPAVRHRCVRGSLRLSAGAAAEVSLNRLRRRYERAGAVLAPTTFMAGVLRRAGLRRVRHVPNPVRPTPLAPAPAAPRFVFAGRLTEDKGVDVLLDAAAGMRSGARITVLGSGRGEAEMRERIAAQALRVDLRGFVAPEAVAGEFAAATAVVVPSLWPENGPLAIMEAGAHGVPAVVSDLGAMAELVRDGRTGRTFPPGDGVALARILDGLAADPRAARALGVAARERVLDEHAEERHLDLLLDAYAAAAA
jgi:glycosyltransferase involved in cell wall biosynthesis